MFKDSNIPNMVAIHLRFRRIKIEFIWTLKSFNAFKRKASQIEYEIEYEMFAYNRT